MRYRLLFSFFWFAVAQTTQAQCDPKQYAQIFSEAQTLQEQGQFIEAKYKYEAAKIYACGAKDLDKADKAVDALFEQINRLREQADSSALTAYANDLAYKSKIALRDGDRNTAFRLAELAHLYVDPDNPKVIRSLVDALYYNDNPKNTHWLPRVTNLEGHSGVFDFVFSPDGKRLASGYADGKVRIWDVKSSKTIVTLEGHTDFITSVAFSPDGKRLASGSSDKTVRIWDLESGTSAIKIEEQISSYEFIDVKFSPDGKRLATAENGGVLTGPSAIKIWDSETGQTIITLDERNTWGFAKIVAFSPDGECLAAGYNDGVVKIWDLESGNIVLTLKEPIGAINCIAFSPDGKTLATGTGLLESYNTIKIWDLESGKITDTLEGHMYGVYSIAYSPDGKHLASGSADGTARIWDLESGKTLNTIQVFDHGNVNKMGASVSVAFSPNGNRLATSSGSENTVKVWEMDSGIEAPTFEGDRGGNLVSISPDGKRFAMGGGFINPDYSIRIWDLENGKTTLTLEGHMSMVYCIAYSPDGKHLASGSDDGTARIWDLESGKEINQILDQSTVLSVTFSPDGKRLATGSIDGKVMILDLESDKKAIIFKQQTIGVESLTFSPDGKRLAIGSSNEMVKIWDLDTGNEVRTLNENEIPPSILMPLNNITFSPDGQHLAIGSGDGMVRIWDIESGKTVATFQGHLNWVSIVAYSPNGKLLASGSRDQTVKIWDIVSGKELVTLEGHANWVKSLAFSPDSKKLTTWSDNTAKIWELTGDGLLRRWRERGGQAEIDLSQLQQYSLSELLEIHPENEHLLLQNNEIWQIAAFADLYTTKIIQTGFPKKEDYERATRLYQACLNSGKDNAYFLNKLMYLGQIWKKKAE